MEVRQQLPDELLEPVNIPLTQIRTQTDMAKMMLDFYEGLQTCNYKLESIKRLNNE